MLGEAEKKLKASTSESFLAGQRKREVLRQAGLPTSPRPGESSTMGLKGRGGPSPSGRKGTVLKFP